MSNIKICHCIMTMNRLSELIYNINRTRPYVDRCVIVDGGSIDDSIFYLRNRKDIELYIHPWKDNFSEQRCNYLNHVEDNWWVLAVDPDEIVKKQGLERLHEMAENAENKGINVINFRSNDVFLRGDDIVHENLSTFRKPIFFKKIPGSKYIGNPHESLLIPGRNDAISNHAYDHIKQDNINWHRGVRNFFVGGGGDNERPAKWVEFRNILKNFNVNSWHEFEKYMLQGNMDKSVKDWIIAHMHDDERKGDSEVRECYKLYYRIYHLEEEPQELKGISIK